MNTRQKKALLELVARQARELTDIMGAGLGPARERFKKLALWCPEHLYNALGKDDAQTCLGLLRELGEALGFSREDIHDGFKSDATRSEHLTQDDLDAFEVMLQDRSYQFGSDGANLTRFKRTLRLLYAPQ